MPYPPATLTGAGWIVDPIVNPKSGVPTPSPPYVATLGGGGWVVDPIPKPPTLGPELVVNGNPMDSAGWVVIGADATHIATFGSGVLRYQSDTTSPQLNVLQEVGAIPGKTYEISITIASRISGTLKTDFAGASHPLPITPGVYTVRLVAAISYFNLTRSTATVDISISRVSIREVS